MPFSHSSSKGESSFCKRWVNVAPAPSGDRAHQYIPKSHASIGDACAVPMQNLQRTFFCLGWVWVALQQAPPVTSGATFDPAFTISNSAPIIPESVPSCFRDIRRIRKEFRNMQRPSLAGEGTAYAIALPLQGKKKRRQPRLPHRTDLPANAFQSPSSTKTDP